MYWKKNGDLVLGGFPSLDLMAPDLEVVFASRRGGLSLTPFESLNLGSGIGDDEDSVRLNRERLLSALPPGPLGIARGRQVHGDHIEIVTESGIHDSCDGLITDVEGLSLAISTADCLPVFIYSPPERVLAALHVGREGARKGIIEKAVGIMTTTFDVRASTLVAGTGPGICARCYEVGADVAADFPEHGVIRSGGKYHLDLIAFCEAAFTDAGILSDRTFRSNLCTACESGLCFSYRRDGGKTGRHWTIATITG